MAIAWRTLEGLLLGVVLAVLGNRRKSMAVSAGIVVVLVMSVSVGSGGWDWGLPPVVLLLGMDLATHYGWRQKARLTSLRTERQWWACHVWDGATALSLTGWATVLALAQHWAPPMACVYAASLGALATAMADVLATQLGLLSSRPPRSIASGLVARPGAPGAITPLGLVAGLGGAWLMGIAGLAAKLVAAWLADGVWERPYLWLPLAGALGGLVGCLVDSFLGGTAQGVYHCERCDQASETRQHICGAEARQTRGWVWLTSASVNAVSTVVGAAFAAALVVVLAQTA